MKNTLFLGITVSLGFLLTGCQQPATTNTTVNTNAVNTNFNTANTSASNANMNMSNTATDSAVETKEPEKYQAKVAVRLETMGSQQNAALPPIAATVARDGANRRMEFSLPNGEKLIYLDVAGKNLIISPDRKQYAELNQESLGFEVRQFLMPAQIVERVKNQRGVERVGEEQLNGRTVIKYRYGGTTNTQTQAGQVNTESFLLVDKETGLPLRTETVSESQSGQVQGVKGLRIVTEMSDISTNISPELFTEPTDYKKVQPEEIRSQVNLLFSAATAIIGQMIKSAQPAMNASPTASPTAR